MTEVDLRKDESTRRRVAGPVLRVLGAPAVAAASSIVLIGVDRSAWHLSLPGSLRTALLAHTVTQTIGFALLIAIIALAGMLKPRFAAVGAAVVIGVAGFVWFASWGMFWGTGRFLDQYSAAFALASPASMTMHVAQLSVALLVLVPVAAVVLGAGTVLLARHSARAPIVLRAAAPLLLLFVLQAAVRTDRTATRYLLPSDLHVPHPESGTNMTVGELFAELRESRTGPTAHLRAELGRERLLSEMSPNVAVEWRDQSHYDGAPERPYNVVLIVIESLRSDELEAYGSALPVTPAVDAVARDAAVYIDHYAVASHSSYSSVAPVSSQYPLRDERLHVYPEAAEYPRVLLYDLLAPIGYRTAIISSQNERWGGMANFLASDRLDHFFHAETFRGQTYIPPADEGFARFAGQYGLAGKIDDRHTITETIRWIGDGGGAPFFVYVNLQNSHVPYPIPADAPTPFGPRSPSFPIRFNYFPPDSAHVVRGVYRNALHYVDAQIGRLVEHLQQAGLWDESVFLVMGDHGQAFYEHGFAAHGNELYEELLRTPLIIRAPGLEPGPRRGLAQHVDVAPTVLDLLGMPPHDGFQGLSLASDRRSFAYATVQTPMANQYSISHGSYKLVVDARRQNSVLRNLAQDPLERRDWSAARPDLEASLRERLETWRAAQLGYYSNPVLQANQYAPVLTEPQQVVVEGGPTRYCEAPCPAP
jgi:arylsulfatase A-like enzyme